MGVPKVLILGAMSGLLLLGALFYPPLPARADAGPKPGMDFFFTSQDGSPVPVQDGVLLECADPECKDASVLKSLGPQYFSCKLNTCASIAYGYAPYHRLSIQFVDGRKLQSNVFTRSRYHPTYDVTVEPDGLVVRERNSRVRSILDLGMTGQLPFALILGVPSSLGLLILLASLLITGSPRSQAVLGSRWMMIASWLVIVVQVTVGSLFSYSLLITVLIEGVVVWFYATWRKWPRLYWLTLVTLVNLLTQQGLFLLIMSLEGDPTWLSVLICEPLIFLAEAGVLALIQRKTVRLLDILLLTMLMNLASLLAGILIPI